MRVRVLTPVRAYWNYGVQSFEAGEELSGDLARHLLDNGGDGAVEVLETDPQPPAAEGPPEDADDADPDTDAPDGEEPPVDGTIDQLMAWVAEDAGRASAALAAEQAKEKPRSTVLKRLAAVADL